MTIAIVLGGARCLYEDMEAAHKLFTPDVVVAVKDIGITYPNVDHWATYHPERLVKELHIRRSKGLPDPLCVWTYGGIKQLPKIGIEYGRIEHRGGSSGFMGMVVACKVANKAILCGIPMDPCQDHFERKRLKGQGWPPALFYRKTWTDYQHEFKDRVRSMSGWTRELLGAPTREWIDAGTTHGVAHQAADQTGVAAVD